MTSSTRRAAWDAGDASPGVRSASTSSRRFTRPPARGRFRHDPEATLKIHDLSGVLSNHPFLAGLRTEHVDLIVGCAQNRRLGAGEYAAREGDAADEFYLIRDGQVALEVFTPQTGAHRILTLHEGEVVGWSGLLAPYLWKFDTRAVSPVRMIAIDGKCLRDKCDEDFELGYRLYKRVAHLIEDRLSATRLQLLDLYRQDGRTGAP